MRRLWTCADAHGFDWFSVSDHFQERGTPQQVVERANAYRDAGVQRLNIGLRQGPYDWEALHAFAEIVLPALGVKRP